MLAIFFFFVCLVSIDLLHDNASDMLDMVIHGFYQVLSMSKLETHQDLSLEGSIKSGEEGASQVRFCLHFSITMVYTKSLLFSHDWLILLKGTRHGKP